MKKILVLTLAILMVFTLSGCGQSAESILSQNFDLHPIQKVNGVSERTIACKSNKIAAVGTEYITPILKEDKNKISSSSFYQDLLTYQVLNNDVKLSGKQINEKQPYPNVFYLFDTSNDANKVNYIVIFFPEGSDMHTYIFKVNPIYMYDLISCLKKFEVFTQKYLTEKNG